MSFPRYPKYKDSGVEWLGQVPTHWGVKRLKHSLRLLTEKTDRREHPVALENIEGWTGCFIPTETEFQGEGIAFDAGDILFGKLRPYLAKAYLADSSGEAVGDFHVMRPALGINSRFAQYQILNREFIAIVDGSTFGSKMPRASWDFVGGMMVSTPPLPEQTQIAAFLDRETAKIDELVAEQQRLMVLLKEKRQAVISRAVTKGLNPDVPMKPSGIEWLGDVPAHWGGPKLKTLALKQQAAFTNGPFGSDLLTSELQEDGVPVIYIRDLKVDGYRRTSTSYVTTEKAIQLDKFRVDELDVLIAKVGDPPGFCCTYPEGEPPGIICQDVIRMKPNLDLVSPSYLCFLLNSPPGIEAVDSICVQLTRKRFSLADLHSLRLPLPPRAEQDDISQWLSKVIGDYKALSAEAQRAIDLLQERRTALISAAVTGQIDVRQLAEKQAA